MDMTNDVVEEEDTFVQVFGVETRRNEISWKYYIKNQQDATLAILFISHCKITLHVSDAFCVHHQEY
jgi:hypothetical protein